MSWWNAFFFGPDTIWPGVRLALLSVRVAAGVAGLAGGIGLDVLTWLVVRSGPESSQVNRGRSAATAPSACRWPSALPSLPEPGQRWCCTSVRYLVGALTDARDSSHPAKFKMSACDAQGIMARNYLRIYGPRTEKSAVTLRGPSMGTVHVVTDVGLMQLQPLNVVVKPTVACKVMSDPLATWSVGHVTPEMVSASQEKPGAVTLARTAVDCVGQPLGVHDSCNCMFTVSGNALGSHTSVTLSVAARSPYTIRIVPGPRLPRTIPGAGPVLHGRPAIESKAESPDRYGFAAGLRCWSAMMSSSSTAIFVTSGAATPVTSISARSSD